MIYLLDTNTISDIINLNQSVRQHFKQYTAQGNTLAICPAVYYELRRGLIWKNQQNKLSALNKIIMPQMEWVPIIDADWIQASQYWADATSKGRQLDDIDSLVAAIASRLQAILVTSDTDFDVLPIQKESWR